MLFAKSSGMKPFAVLSLLAGLAFTFGCSSSDGSKAGAGGGDGEGGAASGAGGHANEGGSSATSGGGDGTGGSVVSVTGVSKVLTGEYVTSYLKEGRLYGIGGTLARLGAGPNPPDHVFPPAEVAFAPDLTILDGAGGLHFTIAADDKGQVWEWGDIASNPALANSSVPVQITPDFEGNAFSLDDGAGHHVRSMAANGGTSVAVKGDGTVWIWDDTTGGLQGDGTAGSATTLHPVRVDIPLPSGVGITKIAISDVVVALASDGTVWTWGGNGVVEVLGTNQQDFSHPHPITTTKTGGPMPKVVDIAAGSSYYYALTAEHEVYSWGLYMEVAGNCPGSGWCPEPLPKHEVDLFGDMPQGTYVTSIASSSGGSYAILNDGTLWAWGTDGQGLVGDGHETDFATSTPPYTWDWGKDDMLVTKAVHIATQVHNFKTVFSGTGLVFYAYAMTEDGRLFSWGRNKTADLGNGVLPTNSQQAAANPNSWDVTTPTEVNPFTATDTPTNSPVCIQNPNADSCWCAEGPDGPQNC
jgi:alpha-tubulin suppressor-like RCC1 family protein